MILQTYCVNYRLLFLLCVYFVIESGDMLTCIPECQCRFYPRRPVICSFDPKQTRFPNGIPAEAISLSISGNSSMQNAINGITKVNFDILDNLTVLQLSFCQISSIEDGAFSDLSNLLKLHLQRNNIRTVSAQTFSGLRKLKMLDLTGNQNVLIRDSAFASLTSLQNLYLGELSLETIPKSVSMLTNLKTLYLHGNKLKDFSYISSMVSKLTFLKHLDLTNNLLTTISNKSRNIFTNNRTVELFDNPWHCNCELRWIKSLPQKYLTDGSTGKSVICVSPDKLKYKTISDVADDQFSCSPPQIINFTQNSYSVKYQGSITIKCLIEGDPFPDVIWKQPNGVTSGNLTTSGNGILNIKSAKSTDNGIWTLKVASSQGRDERQIRITVVMPTTTTTKSTSTTRHRTYTSHVLSSKLDIHIKSTVRQSTKIASVASGKASISDVNTVTPLSTDSVADSEKKEGGMNMMLIAGAGGGGAAVLGLLGTVIYCVKRSKNKNKVEDIPPKKVKDNFDSVRTPRQSNRTQNMRQKTPVNSRNKSFYQDDVVIDSLDF